MFWWVANSLSNRGHEVIVLTWMKSIYDRELVEGITHIKKNIPRYNTIEQVLSVKKEIRRLNPDCCVSFGLDANVVNIFACLGNRTKSVVCERNDPYKPHYYKLLVLKHLFRLANGAVFQLAKVRDYYSMIQAPTAVIPNPVTQDSQILLKPIKEREKMFVTVGRLDLNQKRQDVLLSAFSLFVQVRTDYRLIIYGDGHDQHRIEQMIKQLGLGNYVVMGGVSHDVLADICHARFFVLPSDYEGIPNALIEAMSIGLPCIATDCRPGGATMLIDSKAKGIIVPPHSPSDLCKAMLYATDHLEEMENCGQNAKEINDKYSEEQIGKMWNDYLMSLASNVIDR